MKKYKCPEGDYEQEMPGMCPNHPDVELEMVDEEETEMEGKGMEEEEEEMGKKEEGSEMDDEE